MTSLTPLCRVLTWTLLLALCPVGFAGAQEACPELSTDEFVGWEGADVGSVTVDDAIWSSTTASIAGCPFVELPVERSTGKFAPIDAFASHVAAVFSRIERQNPHRDYVAVVDGPEPYAGLLASSLMAARTRRGVESADLRTADDALVVAIRPVDIPFDDDAEVKERGHVKGFGGDGGGGGGHARAMSPIEIAVLGGPAHDKEHSWITVGVEAAFAPRNALWFAVAASTTAHFTVLPLYVNRWESTHAVPQVDLVARFGFPRDWPASLQVDVGAFVQPGVSAGIWAGMGLRLQAAPVEFWMHLPIHLTEHTRGQVGVLGTIRVRFSVPENKVSTASSGGWGRED